MDKLTRMERVVWAEMSWGRTIGETSEVLGIKESTVRTHLKHLYQKLQVNNRVLLALKFHGLERDEAPENWRPTSEFDKLVKLDRRIDDRVEEKV
jgi:DNA-binding CsgD family transcriptional regulator